MCGGCGHPKHWRECRAPGCYCRRRGPSPEPELTGQQRYLVGLVEAEGFSVEFRPWVEDSQTPGFLGQIAGRTSHEQKKVVIATRNRSATDIGKTLIHELHHVRDPQWDCGSRSPLS